MNIQIFGTNKCFDTKKAQRYFKERRVSFQMIDLKEKDMSRGEMQSVIKALGGIDNLVNPEAKDKETLGLLKYSPEEMKLDILLDNQSLLKTPVVRNGKVATVGYCPDVWKNWE